MLSCQLLKVLNCSLANRKLEYTKESLLKFKAEMEQKAINEKTGGDGGGMFGGFGGGGGGGGGASSEPVCSVNNLITVMIN